MMRGILTVNSEPVALNDAGDIASAVEALDGSRVTEVMLKINEATYTIVGGGAEGRVAVDVAVEDDLQHLATPGVPEEDHVSMVFCGQRTSIPARYLTTKEKAVEVLRYMAEHADRKPDELWEPA